MNRFGVLVPASLAVALTLTLMAQDTRPTTAPVPGAPSPAVPSGTGEYRIDSVHSSNYFCIRHLNVANFYGRFNEVTGTFILDDAEPARCAFDVTIRAASLDTNHPERDKHLKSAEFFDVEQYPEIRFRSTRVRREEHGQLAVLGDLTLRGVTRPVTATVTLTGAGPGMRGEPRAGFEATLAIKRSEFGMTALVGPLGDEVRITVSVEGIRETPAAPAR